MFKFLSCIFEDNNEPISGRIGLIYLQELKWHIFQ